MARFDGLAPAGQQEGLTRLALATQIDDGPLRPFGAEDTARFAHELGEMRGEMLRYTLLSALYGPWGRGLPALVATLGALTRRLQVLGCHRRHDVAELAQQIRRQSESGQ